MSTKKLTVKQDLFCSEYIIDLHVTNAALRAGYSERSAAAIGSENLTKPEIQARLAELMHERSERLKIDADWVLRKAVELHDKCMEAEPMLGPDGENLGYAKFNPAGAAKAIELVGKHVSVKAFEESQKGPSDSLADSVNKLIDKLPN